MPVCLEEKGREEEQRNRGRRKKAKRECVCLCALCANSWCRVGGEVVGYGRSQHGGQGRTR